MTTVSFSPAYQSVLLHKDSSNSSITTTTSVDVLTLDNDKKQHSDKKYGLTEVSTGELVLPPCRICAEKASGFHYGVNTCEACKVRPCIGRKGWLQN
jgi:Zinc finger, C4 type (two domains)